MYTEKNFNYIINEISEWINTPKVHFIIPERVALLGQLCVKLQTLLDSELYDTEVKVSPCNLQTGDAVVSFETYDFVVRDITAFMNIVKHFSNFEMYPTENGNMRFSGIFSHVAAVSRI